MTIKSLFEELEETDLFDKLSGELILHNKYIVWTFDIDKNLDDFEVDNNLLDDEIGYTEIDFNDIISNEEKLKDAYDVDIELIQDYLNRLDDCVERKFTDPVTSKNMISFRFF